MFTDVSRESHCTHSPSKYPNENEDNDDDVSDFLKLEEEGKLAGRRLLVLLYVFLFQALLTLRDPKIQFFLNSSRTYRLCGFDAD